MSKDGAEELGSKDFEERVLKSKKMVVVDFFAPWCGPCQIMLPKVDKVAKDFKDQVDIFTVDIEKNPEIASKYSVLSVPTLIFFKNGKPVDQSGFLEEDQLSEKIKEFIK